MTDWYNLSNNALSRALNLAMTFYLASHSSAGEMYDLPNSIKERAESEADVRELVFSARAIALGIARREAFIREAVAGDGKGGFEQNGAEENARPKAYEWIAGSGGLTGNEMEPIPGRPFDPTLIWRGWTIRARLSWAILEEY